MKDFDSIHTMMTDIGKRARTASHELAFATPEAKEKALLAAAEAVWAQRDAIMAANALDMDYGRQKGLSAAMMDRLMLDEARIESIVQGLRAVAGQDDPVGEVMAEWDMPQGFISNGCELLWA